MIISIFMTCLVTFLTSDIRMEKVVVTATKRAEPLEETPFFGTSLRRVEIERSGVNDLGELLSSSPFISIRDYGPNSMASISIRGASSSQVLVLIDGERLNNSQSGGADLDKIPLDAVERIEIVRGGYSALHGADAVGGVINIITSRPDGNRIKADIGLGGFGEIKVGAQFHVKYNFLSGMLSLWGFKSDGDYEYVDRFGRRRRRINAGTNRDNLLAKLRCKPYPKAEIEVTGGRFRSRSGDPGMMGYPQPNAFLEDNTGSLSLHLRYDPFRTALRYRSSLIHYFNPDSRYSVDDTHRLRSFELEMSSTPVKLRYLSLLFAAALRREILDSSAVGHRMRDSLGIHLSQEMRLKRITLFGAVRWDMFSDFGSSFSPKAGFKVNLIGPISVKGSLGRSYRAPTFNDLYWPEDAFAKGNQDLKPEISSQAELGLQLSRGRVSGELVLFSSITKGLIQWAPGRGGKWYPQNLAEADVSGLETGLHLKPIGGLLDVRLSYSFTDARDQGGYPLLYRPRHSFGYRLRIGRRLWTILSGRAEGRRFYRKGGGYLDPYHVHDLRVGISFRGIELIFALENLFNERYMLSAGYPLPGRRWSFRVLGDWEGGGINY
ncbi:TPA: TonB-dependent receptor [Candidatus Bipolaricaulota bacterium]|nr:TonB-dependent receptor [Candidatus Bipolaricaulota bacterium]